MELFTIWQYFESLKRPWLCGRSINVMIILISCVIFYRSDEKARPRVQKKQKDSSYLNTFSNKIKQNIDKYRTELTGDENEHGNEDNPAASTVRRLAFVYYDVKNKTSSLWRLAFLYGL